MADGRLRGRAYREGMDALAHLRRAFGRHAHLAGAAIALIVTPFSGVEARRRISEKVEKAQKERTAEMAPTNGEMAPTNGETAPTNGSSRSSRSPASPYAG